MHSEQDWVTQEDASNQAYKYYMRNDPTTREFMGSIETEYDDYLKQEVRFRHSKVGTVRGATKENMREVKVYLDPIPHLRVNGPKPLQGWYSNKNDGSLQNQRDRPCMTDAVLTQPYGGYCFPAGTLVETPIGPKPIEKLTVGDLIWGQDATGDLVRTVVQRTFIRRSDRGIVKLSLGDDQIHLTPDHPVYSLNRGDYVAVEKLRDGESLEARVLSRVFNSGQEEASEARFVTSKEVIPECVDVFDIQTTTHNFYVRGALGDVSYHVHNCSVGCTSFCYVMSGQYGYRATGLTSVPLNYGEYVRKQLAAMQTGQAGYFSSFTDPFMKIEELYHNTQQGATAFVEAGLPVFFLSRLKYPGWAFDLLQRNKYSYMQKSINTPNQADWKLLSPGAASLAEHFEQIREARRKGIYVSIQCNPIIPGVVDHSDIEHLLELLAEAGANHVIFKFVESNHAWRASMVERLTEKFGTNRMAIFAQLMVEKQGGNQTTIEEGYRREGHERYRTKCQRLGLTSSLCYEYTRRPAVAKGKVSGLFGETSDGVAAGGKWISMGPEFLTSEQCHGQRVPFHVKDSKTGKFKPLAVCPPSGCLSCGDSSGKGKCGSELLGAAKALTLADFKKDPGITRHR